MRTEYLVNEHGCWIWQMCRNNRGKAPVPVRQRPVFRTVDPRQCILWKGCRDRDGYGARWMNGKRVMVHRWAYEQAFGQIPSGMQVDHLCKNRACYNPEHLEAVTRSENIRRAAWRETCKRGHAMTPANISSQSGRRKCRACHLEVCARSRQRKRETPATPEDRRVAA